MEDIRLLRDSITTLLHAEGMRVVASVRDRDAALWHVRNSNPRIVLFDAAVGGADAPRVVDALHQSSPETRIVVMDLEPDHAGIVEFVRAGAMGFILRDATAEAFVTTVRTVAAGASVLPSALAGAVFAFVARGAPPSHGAGGVSRMTRREHEVCRLITDGHSNKEIASRLHIATDTVKTHVHNILEKLGVHTRLQVAARTPRSGLH